MEEVVQAVERFRVLDESNDVPPITNGDMGASSSAGKGKGKGDQTPTEEKKAVWNNVSAAHFVTPITPCAFSTLSPPSHPLSCPQHPKITPPLCHRPSSLN